MTEKRNHKVMSDFGIADYYNFYKNDGKKKRLPRLKYSEILLDCLSSFTDLVIDTGYTWRLPSGFGKVYISKRPTSTTFIDGKLVTNRPIDYRASKDLWAVNEAANKARTVVYFENFHTEGYIFYLKYSKVGACYKNKSVYKLQVNRQKKRRLAQNIKKGKLDALLN